VARILVVDDVDVVRFVISKILKRAGHTVEEADDGDAALARITARAPDAVVTDLWMPKVDGWHLIEVLQTRFPAVAVIAMTGGSPRHGQEVTIERARNAGVTEILVKPVDKNELIAAIEVALKPHSGEPQSHALDGADHER
jgi:two-component system chemotaxis response regulator CheY